MPNEHHAHMYMPAEGGHKLYSAWRSKNDSTSKGQQFTVKGAMLLSTANNGCIQLAACPQFTVKGAMLLSTANCGCTMMRSKKDSTSKGHQLKACQQFTVKGAKLLSTVHPAGSVEQMPLDSGSATCLSSMIVEQK